jgi:hypothetical protein
VPGAICNRLAGVLHMPGRHARVVVRSCCPVCRAHAGDDLLAMRQLTYTMHLRGHASPSAENSNVLRITSSGTSSKMETVVGPTGVEMTRFILRRRSGVPRVRSPLGRPVGRRSLKDVTTKLRSFLRWLYMTERTARDLSSTVIAPMLYGFESIPSALGVTLCMAV